ncbi:MAG: hypothetical protein AAGJ38_03015 [Planctomycetota bacterium]
MLSATCLADLQDRVRDIEQRGREQVSSETRPIETAWTLLPRRRLHEWFAPPESPPLCVLVDAAFRATEGGGHAFWIGRTCWPHPRVLVRAGEDGRRLLERSVFLDPSPKDRLWALDLVLRCEGASAVVADGTGLDMNATRRLQLAAEAGRAWIALARPIVELAIPSAAAFRWEARADPTGDGVTHPRWAVTLRRCKDAGAGDTEAEHWNLEWRSDAGVVPLPAAVVDRPAASRQAG